MQGTEWVSSGGLLRASQAEQHHAFTAYLRTTSRKAVAPCPHGTWFSPWCPTPAIHTLLPDHLSSACTLSLPLSRPADSEAASPKDGTSSPPQAAAHVLASEDGQKSLPFAERGWLPASDPVFIQPVNPQRVMPRKVFAGTNTFSTHFFSLFYCVLVTQSSAKPKHVKPPPADFYCPKTLSQTVGHHSMLHSKGTYILHLWILQALHRKEHDHQEHGDAQGKTPRSDSFTSALCETQLDTVLGSLR